MPDPISDIVPVPLTPQVAAQAEQHGLPLAPQQDLLPAIRASTEKTTQSAWNAIQAQAPSVAGIEPLVFKRIEEYHAEFALAKQLADAARLPDAPWKGQMAWETLKGFGDKLAYGSLIPAAAVGSLGNALAPDDQQTGLNLSSLADSYMERVSSREADMADIQSRHYATGGNRLNTVVQSIMGMIPEIGTIGVGTTVAAGKAASWWTMLRADTLAGNTAQAIARVEALQASQLSLGMRLSAAGQGAQEAGSTLIQRMRDNEAAGHDLINGSDIAAGVATFGLVFGTEILGGLSGEMRLLGKESTYSGKAWRDFGKDMLIQPLQEAVQEGGQQIIGDIADGKSINWKEAGWASLAGAIGGGVFAGPAFFHALTSHLPSDKKAAVNARLALARDLANTSTVRGNAQMVQSQLAINEKALSQSGISIDQARDMMRKVLDNQITLQHFDDEAFAKLAVKAGKTVEELAADMGATREGGNVSVPLENIVVHLANNKDDAYREQVLSSVRKQPDMPSLQEAMDRVKDLSKIMQDAIDADNKLPDGTADDTEQLIDTIEAEIKTAQKDAKARGRKSVNARADATIMAALYRTAAVEWNSHAAAKGGEKVTPKQLYERNKLAVQADATKPGSDLIANGWDTVVGGVEPSTEAEIAQGRANARAALRGEGPMAIPKDKWTPRMQALHDLGSAIGVPVYFMEGSGAVTDGRSVLLAADSDMAGNLGHELFHVAVRRAMGTSFDAKLTEQIIAVVGKDRYEAMADEVRAEWTGGVATKTIPSDEIMAEVVANLVRRDPKFLAELAGQNRTIAQRISDALVSMATAMYDKIKTLAGISTDERAKLEAVAKDIMRRGLAAKSLAQPGEQAAPRGTWNPVDNITRLGKAADATTVVHEMMHGWFEQVRQWAADPNAPEVYRQHIAEIGKWVDSKAEDIAKHWNTTKDADEPRVSADELRAVAADLTGMKQTDTVWRAIHEGMTGSFEQYMATGKAPSLRLKRVFESFIKWFANVYASVFKNASGVDLLTPEAHKTFDRFLAAHDEVAPSALSDQLDKLQLEPETRKRIEEALSDEMSVARSAIINKLLERQRAMEANREMQDEKEVRARVEADLLDVPVHHAQGILGDGQIDADEAAVLLANDPDTLKKLDDAGLLGKGGKSATDLAIEAGYPEVQGPAAMLRDLLTAPKRADAIQQRVDAEMAKTPSLSDEDLVSSVLAASETKMKVAAAEYRALKGTLRIIAPENKAKKQAQAKLEKMKEQHRQKIADMMERTKADKEARKAAYDSLVREIDQDADAIIADGAAYQLSEMVAEADANGTRAATIRNRLDARLTKERERATKQAAKGNYQQAFDAHMEASITQEMIKQFNDDMITKTSNAMAKMAQADIAMLENMARRRMMVMPLREIRPDKYARMADAARARRAKAAAAQNVVMVEKHTLDIAVAEALHAEAVRVKAEAKSIGARINRYLSPNMRARLSRSGTPAIYDRETGTYREFSSVPEAEEAMRAGNLDTRRFMVTVSDDLTRQWEGLSAMLDDKTPDFRLARSDLLAHPSSYTKEVADMIRAGQSPADWTLADLALMRMQVDMAMAALDNKPADDVNRELDVAALVADTPDLPAGKHPPISSSEKSKFRKIAGWAWVSQLLPRSLIRLYGLKGYWKSLIVDEMDKAEFKMTELRKMYMGIVHPALGAFTSAEAKAMHQRVDQGGVMLNRREQLTQVMLWGSTTGQQRVKEAMVVRFMREARMDRGQAEVATEGYFRKLLSSLNEKETNYVSAMWEANARIWEFQVASAKQAGEPEPEQLELTPFTVVVGGKTIMMKGGYAAVPYDSVEIPESLLNANGQLTAAISQGMMKPRLKVVRNKDLHLDWEYQERSQRDHIRVAALLPYSKRVSKALWDPRVHNKLMALIGDDGVKELREAVRFNIDGIQCPDGLSQLVRFGRLNMNIAIYTWNLTSAAKQLAGFISAMGHPQAGIRATLNGMMTASMDLTATSAAVIEESAFMRNRWDSQDQDYAPMRDRLGPETTFQRIMRLGQNPIRYCQWYSDVTTYVAARDKAMSEGKSLADAIQIAVDVVKDTQGSALRSETAVINRTQFGAMFTFAGKWAINNANTIIRLSYEAGVQRDPKAMVALLKYVISTVVVGAAVQVAIGAMLQAEDDDEEQRSYGDYQAKVIMDMLSSPHWMMRSAVPAFAKLAERDAAGAMKEASGAFGSAFTMLSAPAYAAFGDDTTTEQYIGSIIKFGGITMGLPSTELNRLNSAATTDWQDGWERFVIAIFGKEGTPIVK